MIILIKRQFLLHLFFFMRLPHIIFSNKDGYIVLKKLIKIYEGEF